MTSPPEEGRDTPQDAGAILLTQVYTGIQVACITLAGDSRGDREIFLLSGSDLRLGYFSLLR